MVSSIAAPKSLSGLWGEALTVKSLRHAGFDVDWEGGLKVGRDLVATRHERTWHVQVKTTQKPNGWVAWARNGQAAYDLDSRAKASGTTGAFYVTVQIDEAGAHTFDLDKGLLSIHLPTAVRLTALTAQEWGDDVNEERKNYATRRRVRVGRLGEAIGEFHREDGVIYPLRSYDYPSLTEFVANLD